MKYTDWLIRGSIEKDMFIFDLLVFLMRASFIFLGAMTLASYVRHRDQTRLFIALTFSSLAIVNLLLIVVEIIDVTPLWLAVIYFMVLIAHPYCLLRVVERFRPVPATILRRALIGMLICWLMVLVYAAAPLTGPLGSLMIVLYYVLVGGYAMTAFIRGARTSTGIVRQRLRFAAIGSGLVVLLLILLGLGAIFPALAELLIHPAEVVAILAAWSFYLGFAPPRWLHSTWQLAELRQFLLQAVDKLSLEPRSQTLERLSQAATRVVGGSAAVTALWDDAKRELALHSSDEVLNGMFSTKDGIMGRAWKERKPLFAEASMSLGADDRRLMDSAGAKAMFVIPIAAAGHTWGLLMVFLKYRSVFIEDDLNLLNLFAEQTALRLENNVLLAAQQTLLEQLANQVKQLEAANHELDAFSYSISHDLRAPLRAVDGFSRIVLEEHAPQLPAEAARYLQLVRTNTQHMGELIDDLLNFSRLGRQPLKKQPLVPTSLVNQVLDELHDQQAGRQVEIVVADLPQCQADPALLKQVYVNLLTNALKFTRKRDVARIEVGCQPTDGETTYFVKDNGAGFNMQYADKLFGVFQRLHRNDEYEGTGVGLAIVQRVVQRHGGRIWVEAEVDKGAAFYFTLAEVFQATETAALEQAIS
jgi:signal transduction histidine kinase